MTGSCGTRPPDAVTAGVTTNSSATNGVVIRRDPTSSPVWVWSGDLDAADTAALRKTWQTLAQDQPTSVIIDLAAVSFLDCAVLSVLVAAHHDARTRLLLQAVPAGVQRLLQATGLGAAFARVTTPDSSDPPGPA